MKKTHWKPFLRAFARPMQVVSMLSILLLIVSATATTQPSGIRLIERDDTTNSISRHGITWYFEEGVQYGRFVNGDYWVVGPVTIIEINPLSDVVDVGGTWERNGSMINPTRHDTQGYDSRPTFGSFSSANNVGRPNGNELSSGNPLVVQPGESLISSISESAPESRPQLVDVAVLTVLDSPVPDGTFRPPYTDTDKSLRWHVNDIDWSALESRQVERSRLDSGDLPDPASKAARLARLHLDHSENWQFDRTSPNNPGDHYGRETVKRHGDAALTLLLDFPQAELEGLAIKLLQIGIDIFGLAETGQMWPNNGAIFSGRKTPLVLAAWLFDDSDMLEYADGQQHLVFMEDQQTNYVNQDMVDSLGYPSEMLGYPEWSIRFGSWLGIVDYSGSHQPDPNWGASYRGHNIANAGAVLSAHIAGLVSEWNWPALFDYFDRVYRTSHTSDDPMGYHERWVVTTNGISSLVSVMWPEFREDYSPVWEPPTQ